MTGVSDYSVKAFEQALGAAVMEQIRQSVAAAPPPKPEQIERLRTIFAPTVARLSQRTPVSEAA